VIPEKTITLELSLLTRLKNAARSAAAAAFAPYSNFHVGAAVVMADDPDGEIFTGCNVENASYGATLCAERNAITTAAARGFRIIRCLAVSTVDSLAAPLPGRSPCGLCRQVIRGFADDSTVVLIDTAEDGKLGDTLDVERLLPFGFRLDA
jgi:cytidine deaminase